MSAQNDVCAECGAPVFAEVMRNGKSVPLCFSHFDAQPTPATPQAPPFILDREPLERLVKAARALVRLEKFVVFESGSRGYFEDYPEYKELKSAVDAANIAL